MIGWPADKQGAGREGAPTGGAATSSSVRSNILLLLRQNNLTLPDQREMGKINTNTNCLSGRTTAAKKEEKKVHNTIRSVTPLRLQRLEVQWEAAAAGLGRQPSVTPPTKLLGAAPETNKRTNKQEKKIDRFQISTVFLNFRQRRQKEGGKKWHGGKQHFEGGL